MADVVRYNAFVAGSLALDTGDGWVPLSDESRKADLNIYTLTGNILIRFPGSDDEAALPLETPLRVHGVNMSAVEVSATEDDSVVSWIGNEAYVIFP